eukprot:scaffold4491_cov119-Isochrysis_galbana.AAC.4
MLPTLCTSMFVQLCALSCCCCSTCSRSRVIRCVPQPGRRCGASRCPIDLTLADDPHTRPT